MGLCACARRTKSGRAITVNLFLDPFVLSFLLVWIEIMFGGLPFPFRWFRPICLCFALPFNGTDRLKTNVPRPRDAHHKPNKHTFARIAIENVHSIKSSYKNSNYRMLISSIKKKKLLSPWRSICVHDAIPFPIRRSRRLLNLIQMNAYRHFSYCLILSFRWNLSLFDAIFAI